MKFELLKLMAKGMPFDAIPELEKSEFHDWLAASQALDIDHKLIAMNVSMAPYWKQNARSGEFNKLKNEQMILLGESLFKVDEDAIQRTRERLKGQGRVRRVKKDGDSTKRNTRKVKT